MEFHNIGVICNEDIISPLATQNGGDSLDDAEVDALWDRN
jgi:hypothetical protein